MMLYLCLAKDNLVDLDAVLDWTLPDDEMVTFLGEEKVLGIKRVWVELVHAFPGLRRLARVH